LEVVELGEDEFAAGLEVPEDGLAGVGADGDEVVLVVRLDCGRSPR